MSGGLFRGECPATIRVSGPAARRGEARETLAALLYELLSRCRSFQETGIAKLVAEDTADKAMEGYVDLDAAAAVRRLAGRRVPRGEPPLTIRIVELRAKYSNRRQGGWRHWLTVENDEVTKDPGGSI